MITVIGSAVLDIVLKVNEEKFEKGEKIEVKDFEFSLGGGALNASLTFKKLGLKPEVYFHLGKDFLGEIIKNKVKKLKLKQKFFTIKKLLLFRLLSCHQAKKESFLFTEVNFLNLKIMNLRALK